MVFSSLTFLLIFLPVLLILYFTFKNIKIKNFILLVFSLLFYAWGEPVYIVLMLISIFVTYVAGLLIDKYKGQKSRAIFSFVVGIVLLLASLLFFKYGNFLIDNINLIFNLNIKSINLALPIGISFYTFQAISYLADVYRGKTNVQKNPFYLALYISLFPQLIAGPIVRYETIEHEIKNRTHSLTKVEEGLKRFILGLSKKVILANSMAAIADVIFDADTVLGTGLIWLGALCYTLQIYFDFSGYSDMAIGLGKVFGFTFLENFNYPYVSKSITEFWRRWHISLSSWFRDYVYIPLGGSRVSKAKHIRNILVVWMLTGFWHGANWNFIIWGLYFGVLLLIEKFILKDKIDKIPNGLRHVMTMFLVVISWVIFRVTDLNTLLMTLKNMFIFVPSDFMGFIFNNTNLLIDFYLIIPGIVFCFPIKSLLKQREHRTWIKILINLMFIFIYIIDISFLVSNTYNPFIYFRF